MAKKARRLESISDLLPDQHNANKHTERGTGMLEKSLREFGAARSIVVDKNGRVIGGNATLEQFAAIGMKDIVVVPTNGEQLVVVQRTDMDLETDARARALSIADNRVAEVDLNWDPEVMSSLEGVDISSFFTEKEMMAFGVQPTGEDSTGEAAANYQSQYGVIIICESEGKQKDIFEEMTAKGFNCRVVVT